MQDPSQGPAEPSKVEEPAPADVAQDDKDGDNDDAASVVSDGPPVHPVPAMQEAFEESIMEATEAGDSENKSTVDTSSELMRKELLDRPTYEPIWATRWIARPGAKCHPIVKLMSQIIFGLHLLHQQQARSDTEVVKILQGHVDDIDNFLARTTEDFELAIGDIEERIGFLQLPMSHMDVFNKMLDDRTFRRQLLEGNVKIEQITDRTTRGMNVVMLDIQKSVNTVQQLADYLKKVEGGWPHDSPDSSAVFTAMQGNEEGWMRCLRDLQVKGNKLGVALVRLGSVATEMNRLAGNASRRSLTTPPIRTPPPSSPIRPPPSPRQANPHARLANQGSRGSGDSGRDKPLPAPPVSANDDSIMNRGRPALKRSQSGRLTKPEATRTLSNKKSVPLLGPERTDHIIRVRPQSMLSSPSSPMHPRPQEVTLVSRPSKVNLKKSKDGPLATNKLSKSNKNPLFQSSSLSLPTLTRPATSGNPMISPPIPTDMATALMPAPLQIPPKSSHSRSGSTTRSLQNTLQDAFRLRHNRKPSQQTAMTARSESSASSVPANSHYSRPSQSSSMVDSDVSFGNTAGETLVGPRSALKGSSHSRNGSGSKSVSHSRDTSQSTSLSGITPASQTSSQAPMATSQRDTMATLKASQLQPAASSAEATAPKLDQDHDYADIIIQPPLSLPPVGVVASQPPSRPIPPAPRNTPPAAPLKAEVKAFAAQIAPAPTSTVRFDSDVKGGWPAEKSGVVMTPQKSKVVDPDLTLLGFGPPKKQRQPLVRSKTEPPAYVFDSDQKIKPPTDSPLLPSTSAPLAPRLGLFPVMSAPTPPPPPPPPPASQQGVTFEKRVITIPPGSYGGPGQGPPPQKQNRITKMFKRKASISNN